MDRADIVHQNFLTRVAAHDFPEGHPPVPGLTAPGAISVFQSQVLSRQLDRASRAMQKAGEGFYTIGSSGHEGMAAVAQALRPSDIAFLHYRDAAFQIARAAQLGHDQIALDMLLSFACRADDPISGGRHKVLGSLPLMIPPQTSTIASHLPKSVGMAFAIGAARRRKPEHQLVPDDAIAVCSFGDASLNHSTAQGAINTAGWTAVQSTPLPLLMICEDNGIGISTKTPSGWVAASMRHRPGIRYFEADGLDIYETYRVAREAADFARRTRSPAFLHLKTLRLYGHAGADIATSYLPKSEVEAEEAQDPLLHSVRLLAQAGAMTPEAALAQYKETEKLLDGLRLDVAQRPALKSASEVAESLIPPARICAPSNGPSDQARAKAFGADLKAMEQSQPLSRLINWALTDLMLEHGEITLMGEDIGRKGGVYGVTQKLQARFGADRVIDTLLDETSILGLAIGMAQNGFLPFPEIQFLAYLHNAEDQLRGEAATLPFFSNGQFTNPMVIRVAGLGYQKGFGGHFHNDNSIAVLRDLPGVIIACPSHGADAVKMMRECVRLAREEQRIVVFLEPIALYPMRDLHDAGDNGWLSHYPEPSERIALGDVGVHGDGAALAIVTYGNGAYLSRQAQARLEEQGVASRVVDMRWLAPLPLEEVLQVVAECEQILVVDECRSTGSQSEGLMAALFEAGHTNIARIAAEDCFIATGPAYAAPLPSAALIVERALAMCQRG
ncbi:MAG: thiamine pyrophosphate-dependent enzyme [Pseudomonadota bacterium]